MTIRELVHGKRPSFIPVRREDIGSSLASLQEEMNRMFDHLWRGAQLNLTDWDGKYATVPAVNILEKDNGFSVKMELAGLNPEDVDLEIRDGFLTVSGKRSEEKEEKDKEGTYLRREMSSGFFERTVSLPETANCDKAEAKFRNGVLTVWVPKKAEAVQKPRKLEIKKAA